MKQIYTIFTGYSKTTCKSIFLMEPMKINPELLESVLKYIVEGEHNWPMEGSILIFLPGMQEIQLVHDTLLDSATFGPRLENINNIFERTLLIFFFNCIEPISTFWYLCIQHCPVKSSPWFFVQRRKE